MRQHVRMRNHEALLPLFLVMHCSGIRCIMRRRALARWTKFSVNSTFRSLYEVFPSLERSMRGSQITGKFGPAVMHKSDLATRPLV